MDEKIYQVDYETLFYFPRIPKNGEGKGGKYQEKENIFFAEETKHGEGKGGLYLEKETIFFCRGEEKRRRKKRKIFGEENCLLAEKEKK